MSFGAIFFGGEVERGAIKKVSRVFDAAKGCKIIYFQKCLIVVKNYFPGNLSRIHKSWCTVLANKFTHF
jgi:hypothetical protein